MRERLRVVLGLLGVAVLAGTMAFVSIVPSQAAWTDAVHVEQVIKSGTWVTTSTSTSTSTTTSTTTTPEPPVAPGPIYPGDETTTVTVTWNPMAPLHNCATVVVGSTSDQPADWRYYIDFSGTPWHGSQPDGTWYPNRIVSGPTSDVILVGNEPAVKLQPGTTRNFTHCVYNGNLPPVVEPGPETYTFTETALDPSTNLPYYACAFATVTGHFSAWGSPQFVGFSVPLDWAAALDKGVEDGLITEDQAGTLLETGLQGNFQIRGDTATWVADGSVYTLTPTAYNNAGIKDGQQVIARGCTS